MIIYQLIIEVTDDKGTHELPKDFMLFEETIDEDFAKDLADDISFYLDKTDDKKLIDALQKLTIDNPQEIEIDDTRLNIRIVKNNITELIENWAEARNLIKGSKPEKQMIKTMEEVTELIDAITNGSEFDIMDAIGDVAVTLIIIARQCGFSFDTCLIHAYNEIKDRKGKMVNGIFVKEE